MITDSDMYVTQQSPTTPSPCFKVQHRWILSPLPYLAETVGSVLTHNPPVPHTWAQPREGRPSVLLSLWLKGSRGWKAFRVTLVPFPGMLG